MEPGPDVSSENACLHMFPVRIEQMFGLSVENPGSKILLSYTGSQNALELFLY